MEWFALLIPVILTAVAYYFFRKELLWWELVIPIAVSVLTIAICKVSVKTSIISDTEYWGSLVTEARYYEYWEEWITQTCSYTTCDGTDKDGNCTSYTTHYYDCSYCDENSAYWIAYDDAGNSWRISRDYFQYLQRKWDSRLSFVELNRSINFHGNCGDDGDMYRIIWNGLVTSSESSVTTHSYTNKVQASHSAFKLPHVSKKDAKKIGLHDYPKFYDYYKQRVLLGVDSPDIKLQYLNGYHGSRNKIKIFVCIFYNKPLSIVHSQKAYWSGGNQNELVVCIGLDSLTKEIQWVEPFSWTDNKRLLVDCREDIAEIKYFNSDSIYSILSKNINGDVHKDFKKDFSYLTVDVPGWGMWLIYILTILVSVGSLWFGITNEITLYTL